MVSILVVVDILKCGFEYNLETSNNGLLIRVHSSRDIVLTDDAFRSSPYAGLPPSKMALLSTAPRDQ